MPNDELNSTIDPLLWQPCREGHERCAVPGVECECERVERERREQSTDAEPPLDERIMQMSLDAYRTPEQRAAMRGALSDAAHLCDALAKQIEVDNPGRGNGKISQIGQHSAHIARNCGNAIWAMREKVKVRDGD